MALAIEFTDAATARTCNRSDQTEREWGEAARDVQESLCVLAESPTLTAYDNHPSVTHEGDRTVFHGRTADVMLGLTAIEGPPPGVSVGHIGVRDRAYIT